MKTRKRLSTRILTFMLAFAMVFTTMSFMPDVGVQEVSAATKVVYTWPGSVKSLYPSSGASGRWGDSVPGHMRPYHFGQDFSFDCSQMNIVAAAEGKVVRAGYEDNGYGHYVLIEHANKQVTLYAHLTSKCVSVGQTVKRGQKVGVSAYGQSTGYVFGTCFHFGIYKNLANKDNEYKGYLPSQVSYDPLVLLKKIDGAAYSPCKSHNWDLRTGKCTNKDCGLAYVDVCSVDTSIKTVIPTKLYKLKSKADLKIYPDTGATALKTSLAAGKIVKVYGTVKSGAWYKIKASGAIGFVQKSKIEGPFVGTPDMSTMTEKTIAIDSFTIKQGQKHVISGTVKSNFPITKIVGKIDSQKVTMTSADFGSNLCTVSLAGTKLDNGLKCGNLNSGTYTLSVTATDAVGNTKTGKATVTVNGAVKAPVKASLVDTVGGKTLTITQKESGATLYYKVGSQDKDPTTATSVSPKITTEGTTKVTAYSKKGGNKSATLTVNVTVSKVATPTVQTSQEGKYVKATIKGASGATLYYKINSGSYAVYNGQKLTLTDKQVLSCYAKKNGFVNSGVKTYTAEVAEPAVPDAKLINTESVVGTGKTVTIGWTKDKRATLYRATLYRASDDSIVDEKETTGASVSFVLPKEGNYYVNVTAENEAGTSEACKNISVEAKNPLKVVFRDAGEDGQILHEMTVDYGTKIENVGEPSKKGFNFIGWMSDDETISSNAYLKTAIKTNTTYTAVYEAKKFKVKLFDQNGSPVDTQTVAYGNAVDTEEAESKITGSESFESGYTIAGWQVKSTSDGDSLADIEHVDSDMEIQAIVEWSNKNLPVVATIESSVQNGDYIEATVKLSHDEDRDLSMYLIYALKAKDNESGVYKSVYLDRKVVEVPANAGAGDAEKTVNIRMKPQDIAGISKFEVTAVECKTDMTTGTAYSELASSQVSVKTDFGPLSSEKYLSRSEIEEKPDREIVPVTEYRYRNKETKYDGNSTLSSYTKEATEYWNYSTSKWQSGSYKYEAENYAVTEPAKSDTTTASYREVVSYTTLNAYRSYAYVSDKKDWYWTDKNGTSRSGQKTSNPLVVYSSVSLAKSGYSKDSDGSYGVPKTISRTAPGKLGTIYRIDYAGTGNVNTYTSGIANTWLWPHSTPTRTLYRTTKVRTRNKFWRWGSYSAWSETPVAGSATKQVETRTVYRYRDKLTEDKIGEGIDVESKCVRHIEGNLNLEQDLNGKAATVMVYQAHNSDPNKYQLQYLGQTQLAEGNHYSFDFIPREEPNEKSDTGNYIVSLSVEGVSGLINVDLIEAEPLEYTVNLFYTDEEDLDEDGNGKAKYFVEGIKVKEHGNVDLTKITVPEREGYVFMGWKNRTTDIAADCVVDGVCNIEAIYAPKQYAVVFVDWINQKLSIINAVMSEEVEVPLGTDDAEGYVFKGWKDEEGTLYESTAEKPATIKVTGNMVVSAEFDAVKYAVTFVGANNEVVSTQQVAYGEAANPPSYTAPEGKGTFAGWSTNVNWWDVDADVTVRAIMTFDEQAIAPTSMVVTDEDTEERSLVLETEEENGDIYYTTDGTEPTIEMIQDYLASDADSYKGSIAKYDSPIQIGEYEDGMVYVSAVTYVESKDISDSIGQTLTAYDPEEDYDAPDGVDAWVELTETTVKASAGKSVEVNVELEENPGLTGYDFLIESDTGVFYTDCDEYGDPEFTEGEVSEAGTMFTSEADAGWRVNWNSEAGSTATGKMFSLTLHASDDAEAGQYPVTVYYAPENTYDTDYESTELEKVKITVTSEASIQINPEAVSLARTSYVFEGTAIEPAVRIEGLKEGDDYTVEYADNINVGTAKAVITGKGDYAGTVEKEFTITQANIANADIEAIPDQNATGSAIEPELTVKYNDIVLEKGKDYEVTFADNTEIGTASVTLNGIGNFSKVADAEFNIVERELTREELEQKYAEAKAELEDIREENTALKTQLDTAKADAEAKATALKEAQDNAAKAAEELAALQKTHDATEEELNQAKQKQAEAESKLAAAEQAKNEADDKLAAAETAKAEADERAAAAEQKAADAEKALEEVKENAVITLSTITVSGIKNKTYTGSEITQDIVVKCGDVELVNGTDYDVEYQNNIKVGKATLTVVGKGKYTGSFSKTFKINPKGTSISKLTRGKKAFTVKWKKQSTQTTGYQIRYSMKSSMSSSKTVTVSGTSTVSKTIKMLKAKKKYYVQVRTYKTVSGTKYYSSWSSKKSVTTK